MRRDCDELKIQSIFNSPYLSLKTIYSSYKKGYQVIDYNNFASVSFPIASTYYYSSLNGRSDLIDGNSILLENPDVEFKVGKLDFFNSDLTLSLELKCEDMATGLTQFIGNKSHGNLQRTPAIESVVQSIMNLHADGSEVPRRLIRLLIHELQNVKLTRRIVSRFEDKDIHLVRRLEKSKSRIIRHYDSPMGLDEIADEACLSRFHFTRAFKRYTGFTPYRYLLLYRIAKAKELLSQGYKVTTVAYMVGFNSLEHFDQTFRNEVSSSPSEFKRAISLK